jgi:hypothetical protein
MFLEDNPLAMEQQYPYQIHFDKDRYHQVREIIEWCLEHIGDGGYIGHPKDAVWFVVTAFGKSSWLFRTNQDATLFALRWA